MSPSVGSVEINETLTMINTLYQEKTGQFQRKKAVLTVQAIVEGQGMKKVGSLSINLADYYNASMNNQAFALEGCPDKDAQITISLKAQALGEATIADNMSDASGMTGVSMGTEGDYSGNLFHDQDLAGFEEEALAPKIIPGSHGKPPLIRGPFMKLPDSGPVNPMKISEAMDNQRQKIEEENATIKNSELKAQIQILEKEALQLKSEKDDLKVQLGISLEKSKKERENYFEHMKNLDTELESTRKKIEQLQDRVQRRDEKIQSLKTVNENMLADLRELEKNSSALTEEKDKLRLENEKLKVKASEYEQENIKLNKHINSVREEKNNLENSYQQLKSTNNQLKIEIEQIHNDMNESRENYSARGLENDPAFENYKKKTEAVINNYKKEIKSLEHEREEALSKQTDMTFELQKSKAEIAAIDERYRIQLLKIEKNLENLREENNELKSKLDEEAQNKKTIERKSTIEKGDVENKLNKLMLSYQELKNKKETLEQTVNEYERQLYKKQNDYENDILNYKKIVEKSESLELRVTKYKEECSSKNKELEELYSIKESLEQENFTLREHLKTATTTEFSDPASIILQEQLDSVQNKLKMIEQNFSKEKSQNLEKIKILENQVSILEKKKKDLTDNYENQVHKLTVDNRMLKDRISALESGSPNKSRTSSELMAEMQKESNSQTLQLLKIDLDELKSKHSDLQDEYKALEKKYVDSKMGWANADLEKENIVQKYRDAQEQLRDYSAQYTIMEVEMYKINERFGQTLNANNELEMELNSLRIELNEAKGKKKKRS